MRKLHLTREDLDDLNAGHSINVPLDTGEEVIASADAATPTPPAPPEDDGYTTEPTHVRLFSDGFIADPEADRGTEWFIDGADNEGNVTETCWSYDTREAALAAIPEFIEAAATYPGLPGGVIWRWDTNRPRRARIVNLNREV